MQKHHSYHTSGTGIYQHAYSLKEGNIDLFICEFEFWQSEFSDELVRFSTNASGTVSFSGLQVELVFSSIYGVRHDAIEFWLDEWTFHYEMCDNIEEACRVFSFEEGLHCEFVEKSDGNYKVTIDELF